MKQTRRLVFVGAVIWCALILLAPVLNLRPIYEFFSKICHQDPDRSFSLAGAHLPVCIRCASIYFGFLLAAGFSRQPNIRLLEAAVIATLMEFAVARLLFDSPWLRSASGVVLGASVAPFVIVGVHDMWRRYGVARGSV